MQPIYSDYAALDDWRELLADFAAVIPERIAAIQACVEAEDVTRLIQLVHQLRGACGSYGFNQVTSIAGELEQALRAGARIDSNRSLVEAFIDTLARITVEDN